MISQLANHNIQEIRNIGGDLSALKRTRDVADYDLGCVVTRADAADELDNAREIHDAIRVFGLPKLTSALIQIIKDMAGEQ